MNVTVNHIQHIDVPVTGIRISKAFYERLGFKNVMSTSFDYNGGKGRVSMMMLNNIIIELYQMPERE